MERVSSNTFPFHLHRLVTFMTKLVKKLEPDLRFDTLFPFSPKKNTFYPATRLLLIYLGDLAETTRSLQISTQILFSKNKLFKGLQVILVMCGLVTGCGQYTKIKTNKTLKYFSSFFSRQPSSSLCLSCISSDFTKLTL